MITFGGPSVLPLNREARHSALSRMLGMWKASGLGVGSSVHSCWVKLDWDLATTLVGRNVSEFFSDCTTEPTTDAGSTGRVANLHTQSCKVKFRQKLAIVETDTPMAGSGFFWKFMQHKIHHIRPTNISSVKYLMTHAQKDVEHTVWHLLRKARLGCQHLDNKLKPHQAAATRRARPRSRIYQRLWRQLISRFFWPVEEPLKKKNRATKNTSACVWYQRVFLTKSQARSSNKLIDSQCICLDLTHAQNSESRVTAPQHPFQHKNEQLLSQKHTPRGSKQALGKCSALLALTLQRWKPTSITRAFSEGGGEEMGG